MSLAKTTFCRICEPFCPLIAEFDDAGKVTRLIPDTNHPSKGIACHKGLSYLQVHNDPDRLNWPIRRQNARSERLGHFTRCSWDDAVSGIAQRITRIREKYGPEAVAIYYGNPFGVANATAAIAIEGFRSALETRFVFSANTQDTQNKAIGTSAIYGTGTASMVPDLRHTDFLLCLGTNPRVSRWTYMSVPNDDLGIVKSIRQRGGTVLFVNPRKTESSTEETGPTLLINPGTDVYFLAGLLHEIERLGGFDDDLLKRYGKNVEGLKNFISGYAPEKVASVTGIDAETIRGTAKGIVKAKSAAVYLATGVNQSRQGVLAFWLAEMINFATGNLGRKGGAYKPLGLAEDYTPAGPPQKIATSVGELELPDPVGYSVLPAAKLASLIRNGDIRALFILGGNPLLSVGGEEEMRAAFEKLELMVSIDIYRQATGELCDYILPATDWLEHMDLNILASGGQLVPYAQYTDAMEQPAAERRNGWWILAKIAQAIGLPSALDTSPDHDDGYDLVNGILAAANLSVAQLQSMPSNTILLTEEPYDSLFEKCLQHPDKKIDCCPTLFQEGGLFRRCSAIFEELAAEPPGALKLISLRTRYMHNSWLVNTQKFRRGRNVVNPLNMTAADAAARGLHDGDRVRVFNKHGSIEAEIFLSDELKPGVVAMSHGYGHANTHGLNVAQRKAGTNCNALMPTTDEYIEPLSYMSWISGVPVEVERANID